MLSSDTPTDVEERGFLRNLIACVDQNTTQLAFVLLAWVVCEAKPILDEAATLHFPCRPSFVGPPPLKLDLLVFQILSIDAHSEFRSDQQESLSHAVVKAIRIHGTALVQLAKGDCGSLFSAAFFGCFVNGARVNQVNWSGAFLGLLQLRKGKPKPEQNLLADLWILVLVYGLHLHDIGDAESCELSYALSTLEEPSARRPIGLFGVASVTANIEIGIPNHVPRHPVAIIFNLYGLVRVSWVPCLVKWKSDLDLFSVGVPRVGNQFCDRRNRPSRVHLYAEVFNDVPGEREHKLLRFSSRQKVLLVHGCCASRYRHAGIKHIPFVGATPQATVAIDAAVEFSGELHRSFGLAWPRPLKTFARQFLTHHGHFTRRRPNLESRPHKSFAKEEARWPSMGSAASPKTSFAPCWTKPFHVTAARRSISD